MQNNSIDTTTTGVLTPAIVKNEPKAAGNALLLTVAGLTAVGGFLNDWNKTHLFNPKWTPHSKFHDAITIVLGTCLGSTALYFLLKKKGDGNAHLALGTLLPAFFWVSILSAFAFPGAKGLEAEFPRKVPKPGRLRLNEAVAGVVMLGLLAIGYYLAKRKRKKMVHPAQAIPADASRH